VIPNAADLHKSMIEDMCERFGIGGELVDYSEYKDDPVGFTTDVLGEKIITDDCKRLMNCVLLVTPKTRGRSSPLK